MLQKNFMLPSSQQSYHNKNCGHALKNVPYQVSIRRQVAPILKHRMQLCYVAQPSLPQEPESQNLTKEDEQTNIITGSVEGIEIQKPGARVTPDNQKPKASSMFGGLFKSLQDSGFGKTSIFQGGVGMFIMAGAVLAVGLLSWARGNALRTGHPYTATLHFPIACGISVGTPVRVRGIAVGSVTSVKPSLERVDVGIEIGDVSSVIPRNSLIEANQSGLIAEPLIDITPMQPFPTYTALPHEPGCAEEGAILCSRGSMQGRQGVALDDLIYIMTRMARQLDAEGFDKFYAAADAATKAINEARPMMEDAAALVQELTPLLSELRSGGMSTSVAELTRAAADAATQIRELQSAVMTEENVRALRQAVLTLCTTLNHVEKVAAHVGEMAGDPRVSRDIKSLIGALSRLLDD